MEARHGQEIAVTCGEETTNTAMDATTTSEPLTQTTSPTSSTIDNNTDEKSVDNEINPPSNTRLTKSQKKRAAARDKALQQQGEQQVLELHASSQSSPKRLEQEALESILTPLGLCICDVAADGNCLYRSIAVATTSTSTGSPDYRSVRKYNVR